MSKLKEKDLLEWLEQAHKYFTFEPPEKDDRIYKRIVEFIKIFYAKEISSGPIEEDISRPVLIAWLQGINQAATSVNDDYVMKATTQLIEMIQKKPEVTEAFIEEKAKKWLGINYDNSWNISPIRFFQLLKDFAGSLFEEIPGIGNDWLPTAENINALPEPVRNYVAGLETNADPPSMVADNIIMRDTIKALEKKLEEKAEDLAELLRSDDGNI